MSNPQEDEKLDSMPNSENKQKDSKMNFPDEIIILLIETETIFLFDMPSMTIEKGTEEGDAAEKDNKTYKYLTIGKGKYRKTISNESQTDNYILKTRSTFIPKISNKSNYASASAWDMYDSFKTINECVDQRLANIKECKSNKFSSNNKIDMLNCLSENINFKNSVIVMERILANNVYNKQQEYFKGITDDVKESESYLHYLWSFNCSETNKKTVTSMCLNPKNSDILAVGYGKFYYVEKNNGFVAIWNIKNPIQPEILINFVHPVTNIEFSTCNPNLLAVGFYNGNVTILDISNNNEKIIAKTDKITYPSYEPIWDITWHEFEDEENVVTAGQDGRINRFSITKSLEFTCKQLIRLNKVDGSIKGKFETKKLITQDVPISRHCICLVLCHHPLLQDIYFVGTMDGCIYRCSVNCTDQYIDVFLAHDGQINAMKFSNFRKNIFVTCGSDWLVKVWMENVMEPLMVLTNSLDPIKSVLFCPTHSTIIAAISTKNLYLWNLKNEKNVLFEEKTIGSKDSILTNINFTNDGKNILIGNTNGDISVYNLVNISNPNDNEANILDITLDKILMVKPDLLKRVEQIRKKNSTS